MRNVATPGCRGVTTAVPQVICETEKVTVSVPSSTLSARVTTRTEAFDVR